MTATRRSTAEYVESRRTVPALQETSTLRLHIPPSPASLGFGGGFIGVPVRTTAKVEVCLTLSGLPCKHQHDPENMQRSADLDGGWLGASFALPPYLVAEDRDVLVSTEARSPEPMQVTAWRFTVRLTS